MIELSTLAVFAGAVLVLLLSPGPNMAFVMAHGAAFGPRGGTAAAFGIGLADLILTVLTAMGITAAALAWTPSFDLIRYAGAAYLLWLACKALRNAGRAAELGDAVEKQTSLARVFMRATLNSLLNPKALLFFMVFLPQFVEPGQGEVRQQLFLLGCALTVISIIFHALLGAIGDLAGRVLSDSPAARWIQSYGLAAVFMLLALRLAAMPRSA
ncbi:MAG: LysE family translocator [Proteobacteria bacterium]|nr:LysE family translocator [Pseudomonadota bacterium]